MFYVYVLKSFSDNGMYIGCTKNLRQRLKEHSSKLVKSTRNRLPFELIYYEACLNQTDAFHRESYLKTTYGRRYLKNRLKGYFTGWTEGFERASQKEAMAFLSYAKGSSGELRTQIIIGMKIGYVPEEVGKNWLREAKEISSMLSGLIKRKKSFVEKLRNILVILIG